MNRNFEFGPALLFCPADRPDRYAKAAQRADAVIIDLEDAVAPEHKAAARQSVMQAELDAQRTIIRVNAAGTGLLAADLKAVAATGCRTIMLPKAESAADIRQLEGFEVLALCETARGVANAADIASAENTVALMWGAEDLAASMGGTSSRFADGSYRQFARYARSHVLIQAAAHGKAAIDAVCLDMADAAGLAAEAEDARASGFAGKAAIHPSQVTVIRRAFAPTAQEIEWASRLLEAAGQNPGVFSFEGRMVDEPLLRQARKMLDAPVD